MFFCPLAYSLKFITVGNNRRSRPVKSAEMSQIDDVRGGKRRLRDGSEGVLRHGAGLEIIR